MAVIAVLNLLLSGFNENGFPLTYWCGICVIFPGDNYSLQKSGVWT